MKKVIIIANEKKKTHNSNQATVLHEIIDKPLIKKIEDNFNYLNFDEINVVVDEDTKCVESVLSEATNIKEIDKSYFVFKAVKDLVKDEEGITVVTFGTTPLITRSTYTDLVDEASQYPMVVLTADQKLSLEQDIIIRNPADTVRAIIKRDAANADQLAIKEVNMNVYAFNNKLLYKYINELDSELDFYDATHLVKKFKGEHNVVSAHQVEDPMEAILIRSRHDLVNAIEWERQRINNHWLDHGVTITDCKTTLIGDDVEIGLDTIIHSNNVIVGKTIIGENNDLGISNHIIDSKIGNNNHIEQSKIEDSMLNDENHVGPWTNLRTGVKIGSGNRIGSSVELKKTVLEDHNALAHNVYLGNTTVGSHCNIGWGVVTANFNGVGKNSTTIGNHSFIGSSSTIIAPVNIGNTVLVAAGSTITKDIEDEAMGISREAQVNHEGKGKKYIERDE